VLGPPEPETSTSHPPRPSVHDLMRDCCGIAKKRRPIMRAAPNTWRSLAVDTRSGCRYRTARGILLLERSPPRPGCSTIRKLFLADADLRSGFNRNSFSLARQRVPAWRLLESLDLGALRIGLRLDGEARAIRDLMRRYSNTSMSLADACLVRLAAISGLPVCTLDSDFALYRTSGRKRLALIMPQPPA